MFHEKSTASQYWMVFLEGSGKKESHRESLSLLKEHLYGGGGGVSRNKGGEDILRQCRVQTDVRALLLNWKGEATPWPNRVDGCRR